VLSVSYIEGRLINAGFIERASGLDGICLVYMEAEDGVVYSPYIDGDTCYIEVRYVERFGGTVLRIGNDGVCSRETSGEVRLEEDEELFVCTHCDHETTDEDSMTYIEDVGRVCDSCLNESYTFAIVGRRGAREYIENDSVIRCETNGEDYHVDVATDLGVYQVEAGSREGNWYELDDLVSTSRGFMHADEADTLDVEDSDGNNYAHPRDVVQTEDGRAIHTDDAIEDIDGAVWHEDDEVLTFHLGGTTKHVRVEDFDPERFYVVGNTLVDCDVGYRPERGAMTLYEWVIEGTLAFLQLSNLRSYSDWVDAYNTCDNEYEEPLRLAA